MSKELKKTCPECQFETGHSQACSLYKEKEWNPTPTTLEGILESFVEKGAEIEHDRWARWQKYLHSKCQIGQYGIVIPRDLYDRWERQIQTPYDELSESEKESDRKETRNYLPIIRSHFTTLLEELEKEVEKSRRIKRKDGYGVSGAVENAVDAGYNLAIDHIKTLINKKKR